jgi:acyl-CoA thioester hydrolase
MSRTPPANRTTPGRRADYRYFQDVTTRWKDNDAFGHVNNVEYFSYFDTAVTYFEVKQAGIELPHGAIRCLVVEVICRYHKSVAFPDLLTVGLRIAHLGNSSVRYELAVFREGEDDAAAEGHFIHVFVDALTQRPVQIPPDVRANLQRYVTSA